MPILLGDITIDFMQMIDVMVDVMVMATGTGTGNGGNNNNNNNNNGAGGGGGEGGGDGAGGNNNNNNNNNNNRRKRGLNRVQNQRLELMESALYMFENEPSNLTMIKEYEAMAKVHLKQYFDVLKARNDRKVIEHDMLGSRLTSPAIRGSRSVMTEHMALEFFSQLMQSFDNFKTYCSAQDDPDCAILNTDWNQDTFIKELSRIQ